MKTFKINIKFLAWFMIIFLVISINFNISQYNRNKELQKFKDVSLEEIKAKKDSIINAKEINIQSLLMQNKENDKIIELANKRYDSLKTIKDKIKVIYKYKYKEINGYDSREIENYWKNELK